MKVHSLIADESVDFNIINLLRKKGYTVRAIAESDSALSDENVLKISVTKKLLLLTEDKDFGELVYSLYIRRKSQTCCPDS